MGLLYYYIYTYYSLLLVFIFTLAKNCGILYLVNYLMSDIPHINKEKDIQIKKIDIYNIFLVSSMDIVGMLVCNKRHFTNLPLEILYFIPVSFAFELIFDLLHYVTHRLAHTKYIYKYIHKTHHKYESDTNILASFHQDPMDLIITNLIPMYITSKIITFSSVQFFIFLFYKTFIEVAGHSGKISNSSSFVQCVWLPKLINIELKSIDHYYHYSKNNCNYAKRFSVWDKMFGTFYEDTNKINKKYDRGTI